MISIYEAVAQKPVPPAQATGAVVPQQQPQPVQVPNQSEPQQTQPVQQSHPQPAAQQQAANAAQTAVPVNSAAAQQELASPQQQEEPSWKKYLKYGALAGAGLGLGAGVYGIANNWDDITGWMHNHRPWPGASVPVSNDETFDVTDSSSNENNGRMNRVVHGSASRPIRGVLSTPSSAPMKGPLSSPNADPASYGQHWPQPGNAPKTLGSDVHQGYSYRGGRSYLFGSMLPADEVTSTQSAPYATNVSTGGSYNGRYHQPFNERDFGLSSGMRN